MGIIVNKQWAKYLTFDFLYIDMFYIEFDIKGIVNTQWANNLTLDCFDIEPNIQNIVNKQWTRYLTCCILNSI